jgi:hypothetical protein
MDDEEPDVGQWDEEPPEGDSPEKMRAFFRCMYQDACARAEAGARESNNPIYLWKLLEQRERYSLDVQYGYMHPQRVQAAHGQIPVDRLPLPDWAELWLSRFAHGLMQLVAGRDLRLEPQWNDLDSVEERQRHISWYRRRTVDAKQAATLVPLTLGFTRQEGWNAFADFGRAQQADWAADVMRMSPPDGKSKAEVRERIMAENGFTDERAFRRMLAKARKRRPENDYWPETETDFESRIAAEMRANPPRED